MSIDDCLVPREICSFVCFSFMFIYLSIDEDKYARHRRSYSFLIDCLQAYKEEIERARLVSLFDHVG